MNSGEKIAFAPSNYILKPNCWTPYTLFLRQPRVWNIHGY